jgi:hypothetical protein
MFKRITLSLNEVDAHFLDEHPEISPSGLLQKAIRDYRELLDERQREERVL